MAEEPQRDRIGDTVRALFSPKRPSPSATIRVADLYCGDGRLAQAATDAGLEIVYSHTPRRWDEHLDISALPAFDLVTATLPDAVKARAEVLEFVFRFLYVRRPNAFMLLGDSQADDKFLKLVQDKTSRMGYKATHAASVPNFVLPGEENLVFVVGTLAGKPFLWPSVVRSRPEGRGERSESSGGPDGRPSRGYLPPMSRILPSPAFGGSSVSAIQAVIKQVAETLR